MTAALAAGAAINRVRLSTAWSDIFITIYAINYGLSREWWVGYWHWWTWLTFVIAAVVTVWFTIGGIRDLVRMFRRLRAYVPDQRDDGRVE